jgi:hypothetical protein
MPVRFTTVETGKQPFIGYTDSGNVRSFSGRSMRTPLRFNRKGRSYSIYCSAKAQMPTGEANTLPLTPRRSDSNSAWGARRFDALNTHSRKSLSCDNRLSTRAKGRHARAKPISLQ